jgi:uncharacterized protein (TIGR02145 family)
MKKLYVLPISLAAALCASLLFSCSSDSGSSPPAPSPESSSSPAGTVTSYCVYLAEKLCLSGTNPCPGSSVPSEECPFQSSNPSSSPSATPSSSSAGEAQQGGSSSSESSTTVPESSSDAAQKPSSSSPVIQNSSSSVLSSSGTKPSSSSAVSSSSSAVVSSSSVTINVNATACRADDNNVYYCQWEKGCYALDPVLSPSKSTCTALLDECKKYSTTSVFVGLSNEGDGVKCGTPGSVTYTLTCSLPTTITWNGNPVVAGEAITDRPSVTCRGTGASGGAVISNPSATWTGPNWNNPAAGTYNVSAEATSGPCSGKTASCGTLTVAAKQYTLSCYSFGGYSVYEGASIAKPEVRCYSNGIEGSDEPGGLTWTGAPNWSDPVEGTYNISVSTSAGNCSGQTASCGTVTVNPWLSCTVPASGKIGEAITTPTATCRGTVVSELTWTGTPNWSDPVEGTYNVSVSASSGNCSGKTAICGTLTVAGPNIADYGTVTIGTQIWMAKNLNYNISGSSCNNNSEANCTKYGRLYSWTTAMNLPSSCKDSYCASQISSKHRGICPTGWHLPSNAEWTTLTDYADCSSTACTKLKATSGWNSENNGLDTYGFAALPGGNDNTGVVGSSGNWWSSTESEYDPYNAYSRRITDGVSGNRNLKTAMYSVRCIKD